MNQSHTELAAHMALVSEVVSLASYHRMGSPVVQKKIAAIEASAAALESPERVQGEALKWCHFCGEGVTTFCRGKAERCAMRLNKLPTPSPQAERVPLSDEQCEWILEDDCFGMWLSSCGELWSFNDGGPKENRVTYCHHCGKKAAIVTKETPDAR